MYFINKMVFKIPCILYKWVFQYEKVLYLF